MITLHGVELSYCDECGKPNVVGVLAIRGWGHRFRLCSNCLEFLARRVRAIGESVTGTKGAPTEAESRLELRAPVPLQKGSEDRNGG